MVSTIDEHGRPVNGYRKTQNRCAFGLRGVVALSADGRLVATGWFGAPRGGARLRERSSPSASRRLRVVPFRPDPIARLLAGWPSTTLLLLWPISGQVEGGCYTPAREGGSVSERPTGSISVRRPQPSPGTARQRRASKTNARRDEKRGRPGFGWASPCAESTIASRGICLRLCILGLRGIDHMLRIPP